MALPVSPIDAAAATPSTPDDGGTEPDDVGTDVVIERTSETTLTYRLMFAPPTRQSPFNVTLGSSVEIIDTANMEQQHISRPGFTRLAWTGEGTPTVTFQYDVAASRYGSPVASEQWLLAGNPYVRLESPASGGGTSLLFNGTGSRPTNAPDRVTFLGDRGFVESGYVYVGPYSKHERTAPNGVRCEVFVPAAASLPAKTYADTLEQSVTRLNVSEESSVVTGVVVPNVDETDEAVLYSESLGFAGLALTDSGFVVSETAEKLTWIHEYVHTRQEFELTSQTLWLSEGTAEYYEHTIGYEVGVNSTTSNANLAGGSAVRDAVLAEPATWETGRVPYTKGARVVAYLDYRIRELTGGNQTFQDVFRRLNAESRPITHSAFKDAVATVVGSRTLDDEIDRYVTTDARIEDVPHPYRPTVRSTQTTPRAADTPSATSTPASPARPSPATTGATSTPRLVSVPVMSGTLVFSTFSVLLVVGARLTYQRRT